VSTITVTDGSTIYYKDWGSRNAQPIVFHHGWPLSADDWDTQMLYFREKGYRVIAHDRRGHGRSSQVSDGHDMDHYAADAAAVVEHLDLRDAIHIGLPWGRGRALCQLPSVDDSADIEVQGDVPGAGAVFGQADHHQAKRL
jgi:non-heme chloroperoxidase